MGRTDRTISREKREIRDRGVAAETTASAPTRATRDRGVVPDTTASAPTRAIRAAGISRVPLTVLAPEAEEARSATRYPVELPWTARPNWAALNREAFQVDPPGVRANG